MPLRETRRFKTKGSVISFGDIMLPLVGIIAIVLLVVAGKFFFLSGTGGDQTPLPRLEDLSSVSPARGNPAQAEEFVADGQKDTVLPEKPVASSPEVSQSVIVSSIPSTREEPRPPLMDILAVPYDSKTSSVSATSQTSQEITVAASPSSAAPAARASTNSNSRPIVTVSPVVTPRSQPQPTGRTAEEKQTPPPASEIKTAPAPTKPSWMVQVGAFSTPAKANAVSQQVTKAGYSATVVGGKNLHRVLIKAGPTREDA